MAGKELFMLGADNYCYFTALLRKELIPATGCTEPIAIAFTAACAREILGREPQKITVRCSGNVIKNVKGVTIPGTDGLKGIDKSAVLGSIVGCSGAGLQVLSKVTSEQLHRMDKLLAQGICDVELLEDVADLDILVEMTAQDQSALVEVAGGHTNVVRSEKNGVAITLQTAARPKGEAAHGRETALDLHGIFDYAATVDVGEVQDLLDRQIQYNSAIAREGIANCYGCGIGACLIKSRGDDVRTRAKALAAAGSDARMGGCPMPVIINSGSGNQGLTVCLPVVVYAQELGADDERLYRALILANLVAIQLKSGIGCLSAFCGAVSAACGAGAAITWLRGGNFEEISSAISNALATSAGIVCDGAKPSCAAIIAVAVDTALLASDLALQGRDFQAGDGLVGADIEETAMNMMRLGRVGMRKTDKEILHMMLRH